MGEPPYKGNRLEPPSLSRGDTPIERDPAHISSLVLGALLGHLLRDLSITLRAGRLLGGDLLRYRGASLAL